MGRKKKVSISQKINTKNKKQSSRNNDNNSLDSNDDNDNNSSSQDNSTTAENNDSQDSNKIHLNNKVLPHKKFDKYRCLLNNIMGHSEDDSETGSNIEDRNHNPSGSSESNSNSPTYITNQLKGLKTFSKGDAKSSQYNSEILNKIIINNNCSNSLDLIDSTINLNNVVHFDTKIPDPTLNLISNSDPRHGTSEGALQVDTPMHGIVTGADEHNGEEEMITVFEIIDENGSENMFYEMKTEDSIQSDSVDSNERVAVALSSDSNCSKMTECTNDLPHYNVDEQALNDFEDKLSNIKITPNSSNKTVTSIECSDSCKVSSNCNKSDDKEILANASQPSTLVDNNLVSKNIENVKETPVDSSTDSSCSNSNTGVRRSSRIKTISDLKQKSKGRGLVKVPLKTTETPLVKEVLVKVSESLSDSLKLSPDGYPTSPSNVGTVVKNSAFPVSNVENDPKPVKVKSRWRRSSEMEMGNNSPVTPPLQSPSTNGAKLSTLYEHSDSLKEEDSKSIKLSSDEFYYNISDGSMETIRRLKQYETIFENEYHCDKTISKEAKKMTCDCFLTKDEIERGELGCGDDCLNRLLMIECNSRCPVGDRCTNRRFQTRQYSNLRVMNTGKKGLGLQAISFIHGGDFLMEYVGEVLNSKQFNQKAEEYSSSDKNVHHYFMALKGDAVIDATRKGSISRFINHSCDPNSETQKWTVNGELRIGFFSKRNILPGEEITFDYQFQRYGKEAQKCYCEAANCRGWIGEEPDSESEEEEEDEKIEESKPVPDVKTEIEEDKINEIVLKKEAKTDKDNNEKIKAVINKDEFVKEVSTRNKHKDKPKKFARAAKELFDDVDLEEDMEMLSKSGIKNQSHTLSLCRAMVRAKRLSGRATLLSLLASADLPCRRLFLDYRGLRLLAPWCQDANASFKLNILVALEKLPIPNKTILQECNILTYLEKWLSSASVSNSPQDDSDNSGSPTLIDESTGLPVELLIKLSHKSDSCVNNGEINLLNDIPKKKDDKQNIEIVRLCKLLLDRWSQLKEVFKIPKKERIEIMKEHERQANEPQSRKDLDKDDTKARRKTRWEERYARPERPTDKDKKRTRPTSPDSLKKVKLSDDRFSLSKEERRREFAERAAREEKMRRANPTIEDIKKGPLLPIPTNIGPPTWMPPPDFNMHSFGPMMMGGMPPPEFLMSQGIPPNYMPMEYMQQKPFVMPFCGPPQMYMPHQGFPMMGPRPPFPQPPGGAFQNMGPPPPGMLTSPMMPPQGMPNIPPPSTYTPMPPLLNSSQPLVSPIMSNPPLTNISDIPPCSVKTLTTPQGVPPVQSYSISEQPGSSSNILGYSQPVLESTSIYTKDPNVQNISTPTDENQDNESDVVVPFTPIRLPPLWRSVKDAKGRIYYYHVKLRVPQWEPPLYSPTPHSKDEDSSNSEEEIVDDEEKKKENNEESDDEDNSKGKLVEGVNGICKVPDSSVLLNGNEGSGVPKKNKKSRPGLVTACWIISPRREEDRIANQLELRKYKENKEKLRRRKEQALLTAAQTDAIIKYKKKIKDRHKKSLSKKKKESELVAEEAARRIKETFRINMAKVMVHHLNVFRRDDCPIGRITNTQDFKHLARKLTHFVMLKELKHCKDVNELECNNSVRLKAKEFVKKYMAKFGPVYERPPEEMD